MFRRLEKLVDPFTAYAETTPPRGVWQFIVQNLAPFRAVIAASLVLSVIGAAIEVWLIG
jgi:ATP-binding cassette subfamily B multidrug efflux pump